MIRRSATSSTVITGCIYSHYASDTFNCRIHRRISCCIPRCRTMSTTTTMSTVSPTPNDLTGNNKHNAIGRSYYYKLIVAYDGTRFHGFQRQIDNETMMKQYHDKKLLASLRPKKRPHYYDVDTSANVTYEHERDGVVRDVEMPRIRKGCNISVQEVLEFVLLDMYNPPTSLSTHDVTVQDISLTFAGRTDKGVHSNGQVCLVQLPLQRPPVKSNNENVRTEPSTTIALENDNASDKTTNYYYDYDCWKLRNDMNSRLPLDISVQHVSQLLEGATPFDPRRDVTLKKYTYTVRYRRCQTPSSNNGSVTTTSSHNTDSVVDDESTSELQRLIEQSGGPHSIRHASDVYCLWIVPWVLCNNDATIISKLCQQFMGTSRNFYYFIHKADRDNPRKTTMHTIHEMSYEVINTSTEFISTTPSQQSSAIVVPSEIITGRFTFIAKSFRRTMIRNIVGYCIDACRRNIPNVPSIDTLLSLHECTNETVGITSTIKNTTNDYGKEEQPPFIISAAPASGLCLESVTY